MNLLDLDDELKRKERALHSNPIPKYQKHDIDNRGIEILFRR